MASNVCVRLYRSEDFSEAKAIEARVGPYRPEDQAEVEAMYERAQQAKELGHGWIPHVSSDRNKESVEYASENYLAFWVALASNQEGEEQVVGLVGVDRVGEDNIMGTALTRAEEWQSRDDVAELRFLRVAPEVRRQGIGTQLTQTVIEWSREHNHRKLILNTTAPQEQALRLYEKLGFREVVRSFLGDYEIVWHELVL